MTKNKHAIGKLAAIMATNDFRTRFLTACLLCTPSEIETARENMPTNLLPFIREEQTQLSDFYAFDLSALQNDRVVVRSDHAIVADWNTFHAFLSWVVTLGPNKDVYATL